VITENRAVAALRFFLVVLFGILVVFQFLSMPGQFAHMAKEDPDDAHLRWPMTFVAAFLILCVQVVVVATWQLLTLVKNDRIFTDESHKWVNAIVWAIEAAWVVLAALFLWAGSQADDPGGPMAMLLILTMLTVLGLLMIVMRALLRRATALHNDMQAVI
jgi:hypothetical protein